MKKKGLIAMLIACSMTFGAASVTACNLGSSEEGGEQPKEETVAVDGVSLNSQSLDLKVNESATLIPTVTPSGANNKNVSWSSDDPSVASVSGGVVTAHSEGQATITVTTAEGSFTATCVINVTKDVASPVRVTSVSLDLASKTLKVGENVTLTPSITPSDAENKNVSWSSNNPSVATVSGGVVTAQKVGTARITVTTQDGSFTAHCDIDIQSNITNTPVTGVTLSLPTATLAINETVTLTATISPSGATNKNVSWSSNNPSVASVSGGVVTAHSAGNARITVTTQDGSFTAYCDITVPQPVPSTVKVTGVTISSTTASLKVNETKQLTCTVTPLDATNKDVTWASGNTGVATVDGNGLVTAKAAGSATITVTTEDGNYTAECKITVEENAPQPVVNEKITYSYAGNECAAFEWADTAAASAKVEYKLKSASSYTELSGSDKQYLVRQINAATARVDFVGLKKDTAYDFKITTSTKEVLTAENVTIHAYDRSGYAHFGKTDGVGAYKDDGTVKSNAKIYYVTESNKNDIDGKGTSLAELLENSTNGTANSLKNSAPIIIRVIGTVKCPQYLSAGNLDNSIPDIDGITRTDQGNDSYWNMIDIKEGSNITVEGIGEDATIFQFGFTWKKCSSIEVRNLTFTDYPEDACSFEGDTASPSSYKYIWLHHSVFNIGKNGWDKTDEQDKHDGDGASDLKGVSNVTFSYLRYNGCHKTGLVGGDDTHKTSNVTFHHNYYNENQQRLPLGRQANMHMYNNYYYQSTMYSISLRANAYAFIENNYFDNSNGKGTVEIRNSSKVANYGYGKLYNNKFANESKKGFQKYVDGSMTSFDGGEYIVEVSSRTATVANTNTFNQNFDTDSSAFYYDATNKKSNVTQMLTADETKDYVPLLAGVQIRGGDVTLGGAGSGSGGGTGTENPNPNPGGDQTEGKTIVLTYSDFSSGSSATKDGITFTITSDVSTDTTNKSTAVTYNGNNYGSVGNIYLSGGAKLTTDSPVKYLEFTTTKAFKITVVAKGGNNRTLHIVKDKTEVVTFGAGATQELTTQTVNAGGTYRLGSTGSGVRIFYVIIEFTD